jgi:hypothetical protein
LCFGSVFFLFEIVNHGSRWGNTAPALARWRHLVALHEATDALHRAMRPASHHRMKIRLHWSRMNTTIHKMMGAIGSGSGQWLLTAALVYGGKAAVVKMVSGSGGGG